MTATSRPDQVSTACGNNAPDALQASLPPAAVLRPQRRLSLVWLIPAAAVVFASWLAYQAWIARGVHITIEFDDSDPATTVEIHKSRGPAAPPAAPANGASGPVTR